MTYRPRARCKRCNTPRALAGGVSRSGLCGPCGERGLAEALAQLAAGRGPVWDAYRDGMTNYVARLWEGTLIPDTLPIEFTQLSLLEIE